MDSSALRTSPSLLVRLQDSGDASAWDDFVARYGPKIESWCRRWRLQDADAQDVTQTVLLKLAKTLRTFVYDPSRSFRGWLKTVTRHAWSDFVAERQRSGGGTAFTAEVLLSIEARDDLERHLEETFDLELLERASANVQARVKPTTWDAFQLTAVEGLTGAEAALRVGMQVAAVYMAKSNVQKMLQEEIGRLEGR